MALRPLRAFVYRVRGLPFRGDRGDFVAFEPQFADLGCEVVCVANRRNVGWFGVVEGWLRSGLEGTGFATEGSVGESASDAVFRSASDRVPANGRGV